MAKKMIRPLRSEADYEAAVDEIERYFEHEPKRGTTEADRFDLLALVIEDYEKRHWPIEPPIRSTLSASDGGWRANPGRARPSSRIPPTRFRYPLTQAPADHADGMEASSRVGYSCRSSDQALVTLKLRPPPRGPVCSSRPARLYAREVHARGETMTDMGLVVVGAAGKMGRTLMRVIDATPGVALAAAVERPGAPEIGKDSGLLAGLAPNGIPVTDEPVAAFAKADGVLDFTMPAATIAFTELAAQARIVHVIGTTGLSAEDEKKIAAAARHAAIVKSGNMSLGVNLLAVLVREAAKALDPDFDIEIVEMHHRHKVDAPSGTALLLGRAAAEGRGIDLADHSVRVRDGHTGPRNRGDIGFATLRGGSVVGEHSVIFAGEGELIELTHKATDRVLFARGAVKAALWGRDKKPGLYSMADVLGLT